MRIHDPGKTSDIQRRRAPDHTSTPAPRLAASVYRSAVDNVLGSPGQPLAAPVKEEMEARLGADFSMVRVHTDDAARASATAIGSVAYTSGPHVVIGPGAPDKRILAHELTHVIQQQQGPVPGTDTGNGLKISDPGDRLEQDAEANARHAFSGPFPQHTAPSLPPPLPPPPAALGTHATLQRMAKTKKGPKETKPYDRPGQQEGTEEAQEEISMPGPSTSTGDGDPMDVVPEERASSVPTYQFDTHGRTISVTGLVKDLSTKNRPVTAVPSVGKLPPGFHGGHVLGLSLGGVNEPKNVVAMYPGFNRGKWSELEREIQKGLLAKRKDRAKDFRVTIDLEYLGDPAVARDPNDPNAVMDLNAIPAKLTVRVTYKDTSGKTQTINYGEFNQPGDIKRTKPHADEGLLKPFTPEPTPEPTAAAPGPPSAEPMAAAHGPSSAEPMAAAPGPPWPEHLATVEAREKARKEVMQEAVANLKLEDAKGAANLATHGHLRPPSEIGANKASYPHDPKDRPYEHLDILAFAGKIDPGTTIGDRRPFSAAQRKLLLQANMARNGGKLMSDHPEDPILETLGSIELDERGTENFPEIDHIIPNSRGGSNHFSNARVVSWRLNNKAARVKDTRPYSVGGGKDVASIAEDNPL